MSDTALDGSASKAFEFWLKCDPAFHFNSDPDQASKYNADPDPQPCFKRERDHFDAFLLGYIYEKNVRNALAFLAKVSELENKVIILFVIVN